MYSEFFSRVTVTLPHACTWQFFWPLMRPDLFSLFSSSFCYKGPKSCGDPLQPEASALLVADKIVGATGWRIGDHVQYECAPGFLLTSGSGSGVVSDAMADSVCQADGTWSGVTPFCRCKSSRGVFIWRFCGSFRPLWSFHSQQYFCVP